MNAISAQTFFDEARKIWSPLEEFGRIIPLCTPVSNNPPALVIGKNHSIFTKNILLENDEIAAKMAMAIPQENTFTKHRHSFAEGLTASCEEAGIKISQEWVGTNRCSVQTGSKGINELKRNDKFKECQQDMDILIKRLILSIQPVNILLAGKYAIELFYQKKYESIDSLSFIEISFENTGNISRVIPIHHPSMNYHKRKIAHKLEKYFIH